MRSNNHHNQREKTFEKVDFYMRADDNDVHTKCGWCGAQTKKDDFMHGNV